MPELDLFYHLMSTFLRAVQRSHRKNNFVHIHSLISEMRDKRKNIKLVASMMFNFGATWCSIKLINVENIGLSELCTYSPVLRIAHVRVREEIVDV